MNIFFDVDHTMVDSGNRLRPGVRELFERLRAWRLKEAREADVPAFVVLPDRTLRVVAREQPASAVDLLAVPGIGPTKVERYGPALLAVIGGDSG